MAELDRSSSESILERARIVLLSEEYNVDSPAGFSGLAAVAKELTNQLLIADADATETARR